VASQLDILALEGYFGGPRRAMLETIMRYSRHRWTLFKLPARRIERRLTVGAQWFAEQISRREPPRVDLVFTSEAINLADLLRLAPQYAAKPAVVYFHDNQLPPPRTPRQDPLDFINIASAVASSQLWFNSRYHQQEFINRATAIIDRHPQVRSLVTVGRLMASSACVPPPLDLSMLQRFASAQRVTRDSLSIAVDMRRADLSILDQALCQLDYGTGWSLQCIGPHKQLSVNLPRAAVSERDEWAQIRALMSAGVYLSVQGAAMFDDVALRALWAGCRCVLPDAGCYPEIFTAAGDAISFHDGTAPSISSALRRLAENDDPFQAFVDPAPVLGRFEAIKVCRWIDERMERMVAAKETHAAS
jgi:hypothetical protein